MRARIDKKSFSAPECSLTGVEIKILSGRLIQVIVTLIIEELINANTMVDWLLLWGATQTVGALVYPILEGLAKEGARDFVKDFFKDSLKKVLLREKDPRQIAAGKAIKELLQLIQQQLKFRFKLRETEIKQYIQEVNKFIRDKSVKKVLGQAFDSNCESLDASTLQNTWNSLGLTPLPDNFNWQSITEQYLMKCQEILWEDKDLRAILDSQNLENIEKNTQELAGVTVDFNLQSYQSAIIERYENLKLDSLDTSGSAYNELKLWQIFIEQNVREFNNFLPQIYSLPKEYQRRLKENNELEFDLEIKLEELEQYKQIYFEQPTSSVVDIVNNKQKYQHTVILGDPGSGKSTFLQYIALNWARTPLNNNPISLPIPLLIELRTYMRRREDKECNNFLEYFHKCSGVIHHLNQHKLHEQLKAGNVLVMFDGLDEVFDPGKREDIITDIHRFTNDYPSVQVIITSRILGYKSQRLRSAGFSHFMLQDLEIEQVNNFIDRWHDLTFKDEGDKIRKRERLQQGIKNSSALRELAINPLLLTMMAILNRNQELPRDRAELYNQASRLLLGQWDIERALIEDSKLDPTTIDYKDKQAILRQIAYFMQNSKEGLTGNLISKDDLERIITDYLKSIEISDARDKARRIISQMQTRNFILCFLGSDYYAFVHRTFLEYFCAWQFVWQFEKERNLSIETLKTDVFGKYWHDETWHEVLKLIAGMIDTKFVKEIIDYLLDINGDKNEYINLLVAAECFLEMRNYSANLSVCINILNQCLRINYSSERFSFAAYEGRLKPSFHSNPSKAISSLVNACINQHPEVLLWLKNTTSNFVKSDAPIIKNDIISTVIQKLVEYLENEDEVFLILTAYANHNNSTQTQFLVVCELAERYRNHPEVFNILNTCAIKSNSTIVRWAGIYYLAKYWKDEPGMYEIFYNQAINDRYIRIRNNPNPRQIALDNIYQLYTQHPQTLPLLRDRAKNDADWAVRETAIRCLADGWKDEPGMIDFFFDVAANDSFVREESFQKNPRQAALEAIIKHYPNHPNTLPLLRDRAENDTCMLLREFAQKNLLLLGAGQMDN